MKFVPISLAGLLLSATASFAQPTTVATQSTTVTTLTITILSPLTISFTPAQPQVACAAPAGVVVATFTAQGGDNTPVVYAATGGDQTDFAMNNNNLVVGSNGIAPANCGTTQNLTVVGTQN